MGAQSNSYLGNPFIYDLFSGFENILRSFSQTCFNYQKKWINVTTCVPITKEIKRLQLWIEVKFFDLIPILLILISLGVICHFLCIVNDWIIFPEIQNQLPRVEWKIIRQSKIFTCHWQPDDHNFSPLSLLTLLSCLHLSLWTYFTSWTDILKNERLYYFFCGAIFLAQFIRFLQKTFLLDVIRVSLIQFTSSESASPRCILMLFSHM
jgi:hypothetical protein